ncbi:MAG TPA: proline-rich domain-containing protein, partial [Pseudoxanthomonas sp.]|nr:proline-rich domain-containing protein [Pseudoxanthomonas sp.]
MAGPVKDSPFDRFERESGDQLKQLRLLAKVLKESPELDGMATRATRQGDFANLGLLPAEDSATLGHYDGETRRVRLSAALFDPKDDIEDISNRLTDVFAHELTHALRGAESRQYHVDFTREVHDKATSREVPRDYTALVQGYIERRRQEEAVAEIGGLNAVASRLQHLGDEPVTERRLAAAVRETSSCVELDALGNATGLKPGIRFDPQTRRVPADAGNQQAVAQCFFDIDRPIGAYVPGAAAEAISVIARVEGELGKEDLGRRTRDAHIDLKALGVDHAQLAREKLHLYPNAGPFHFTDTSNGQTVVRELQPTRKGAHAQELVVDAGLLLRTPEAPPLEAGARPLDPAGEMGLPAIEARPSPEVQQGAPATPAPEPSRPGQASLGAPAPSGPPVTPDFRNPHHPLQGRYQQGLQAVHTLETAH